MTKIFKKYTHVCMYVWFYIIRSYFLQTIRPMRCHGDTEAHSFYLFIYLDHFFFEFNKLTKPGVFLHVLIRIKQTDIKKSSMTLPPPLQPSPHSSQTASLHCPAACSAWLRLVPPGSCPSHLALNLQYQPQTGSDSAWHHTLTFRKDMYI